MELRHACVDDGAFLYGNRIAADAVWWQYHLGANHMAWICVFVLDSCMLDHHKVL
jgi:hypothetical protein